MKTILAFLILLPAIAGAQSNITVTVTLDARQAAWLAANAATNSLTPAAIVAQEATRRIDARIAGEARTPEVQAARRMEQEAVKLFRELTPEQKAAALAVISGRRLTAPEKAVVRPVAEKVLAE